MERGQWGEEHGRDVAEKSRQREELLTEKDKLIVRPNEKRQARINARVDTLALLTDAQSALKNNKLTSDALEEKLQKQLTEREESHRKELTEKEESFRKELWERGKLQEAAGRKIGGLYQKELAEKEDSFRKELSD